MPEPTSNHPIETPQDPDLLVSVDQALARILAAVTPLSLADVPLLERLRFAIRLIFQPTRKGNEGAL